MRLMTGILLIKVVLTIELLCVIRIYLKMESIHGYHLTDATLLESVNKHETTVRILKMIIGTLDNPVTKVLL